VPLPVIQFPGTGNSLISQVRDLAASLDLPWDEGAAKTFFDERLVRNRSPLRDSTPTYDLLIKKARYPKKVPAINLRSLRLNSEPEWPLETHLGVRYAQQRNQLWEMAAFSGHPQPDVVEVLLEGARMGGGTRPGVTLHQIEVKSLLAVGATLMRYGLRPHGLIAHGLLGGRSPAEVDYFFRSVYINSDPLAELLIDVPNPQGKGLLNVMPSPIDHPKPARVEEMAVQCGWDLVGTERLSPGRSGMLFRKRVLTDSELIPVVTDLIGNLQRIHTIDERLSSIENQLGMEEVQTRVGRLIRESDPESIEALKRRVETAESELQRLRDRRSVRLALALSKPFRPIFQTVRSWKKKR
jgi:hypothetical protein